MIALVLGPTPIPPVLLQVVYGVAMPIGFWGLLLALAAYHYDGIDSPSARRVFGLLVACLFVSVAVGTVHAADFILVPYNPCTDPANTPYWIWLLMCVVLP